MELGFRRGDAEESKSIEREDAELYASVRLCLWTACGQGVVMILGLFVAWWCLTTGVANRLSNEAQDDDGPASWEFLAGGCRAWRERTVAFETRQAAIDEATGGTKYETWCYDLYTYNFSAAEERHAAFRLDAVTERRCADCTCAGTSRPRAGPLGVNFTEGVVVDCLGVVGARANGTACGVSDCYRLFLRDEAGSRDFEDWQPFVVAGGALAFASLVLCCVSAARHQLVHGRLLPLHSVYLPAPRAAKAHADGTREALVYEASCGRFDAASYQKAMLASGLGGGLCLATAAAKLPPHLVVVMVPLGVAGILAWACLGYHAGRGARRRYQAAPEQDPPAPAAPRNATSPLASAAAVAMGDARADRL